ncbi:MAG: tRNA (N(6)-L-threonylcarbamoyladenosine(37)-C(2))-methylthiotransferase MtaB [Sedimentisphaerales bacterium]|nr:tRNA (N(6)-L-threonylcarbamoyladenosine(37)-C(2))-methylthiotransferase MtaB [Sedimentisphaerales bacterium]
MRTFAINTLGCKVNQYESQQIRELLEQLGLSRCENADKANIVIINTCCVTHTASAKSRKYIRQAQRLSAGAVIVACGCLPTVQTDEFSIFGENVHIIADRHNLAADLTRIVNGGTAIKTDNRSKIHHNNDLALPPLTAFKDHTRAFLKVQDGCDGYCSYCIVPKTRPIVHSREPADVLEEAQVLVKAGHKEIVITGVFLGAYGQPTVRRKSWPGGENEAIAGLLEKIAQVPDLKRIRLSSLEPADVTERLLDVMKNHRNIMPHLHLSLQSGSDTILRKMNRQYTVKDFLKAIENINLQLDRPAITTDIIVGFPGETVQDFAQSLAVAKLAGFSKIHIFPFSKRGGTAAEKMQDFVNKEVTTQRAQVMRELEKQLADKFRKQFVGEVTEVLVENEVKKTGRCERYYEIAIKNGPVSKGEIVKCKINSDAVSGLVVSE